MNRSNNPETNAAALGAFLLRVTLGTAFVAHALMKLFVFTLPGTAQFFGSLGLPPALGYVVFFAELVGGIALVLGVATRTASALLVPILLGAAWAHFPNGWVFSAKGGGWEYPVLWAFATAAQALLGDGAFALGRVLKRAAPVGSLQAA